MATHSKPVSEDRNGAEPATDIDLLFDPNVPLGAYNPPSAPECLGELLDSRFMLPFSLPSDNDLLVATPPPNSAYSHLDASLATDDSKDAKTATSPYLPPASPRPSSRTSFSSLRPLRYDRRSPPSIRTLPDRFLAWLDEEERARHFRQPLASRLGAALELSAELSRSAQSAITPTASRSAHDYGPSSPPPPLPKAPSQPPSLPTSHSWPSTRALSSAVSPSSSTFPESSFSSTAPSSLDEFGAYRPASPTTSTSGVGHHPARTDSERTVSSLGLGHPSREGSTKTIRRPSRLQTITPERSRALAINSPDTPTGEDSPRDAGFFADGGEATASAPGRRRGSGLASPPITAATAA